MLIGANGDLIKWYYEFEEQSFLSLETELVAVNNSHIGLN